jgi:hypothetical protein
MKIRDVALTVFASVALFAAGCGQKPATTSEAAPDTAAQPESTTKKGEGKAEHQRRTEGEKKERREGGERASGGSALTPEGRDNASPRVTAVTLPEGTALKVRTTTAISTKTTNTGDTFTASLVDDLVQDGVTVAPKGSTVRGRVVDSDPGGRVKGKANISVNLTSLDVDGKSIPLSTDTFAQEAASAVKKDALKVGIGSGLGAAIGAIAGGGKGAAIGAAAGAGAGGATVLATRGNAAVIPSETPITFHLTAPARVR